MYAKLGKVMLAHAQRVVSLMPRKGSLMNRRFGQAMLEKYSLSQYLRSSVPAIAVGFVSQKRRLFMEGMERGLTTQAKSDSDSTLTPPTKRTKRNFDFNKLVKKNRIM